MSPTLWADFIFLPAEPPGKPKNTGVGSLSLLQGIFPTQESNQGLLHCRQILYQLSYQGNPLELEGRGPKDHSALVSSCLCLGWDSQFSQLVLPGRQVPALLGINS